MKRLHWLLILAIAWMAIANVAVVGFDVLRRGFYPWLSIGLAAVCACAVARWAYEISRDGSPPLGHIQQPKGRQIGEGITVVPWIVAGVILFVVVDLVQSK
jgi:hypothetical protein